MILVLFVTQKKCVLECESEYTSRIAEPPCATRCETRPIIEGVFNLKCRGQITMNINETLHSNRTRIDL